MGVTLNLIDIQSGFLSAVAFTANNTLTEEALAKTLSRVSNADDNAMEVDLDMGLNSIFNVSTDTAEPTSLISVGDADSRYLNVSGDSMAGDIEMASNSITGLPAPSLANDAVRKSYVDTTDSALQANINSEESSRIAGDVNLQSQLTGNTPLQASAFSEISWHGQTIENSVTIPDNKNAWSFGPTMSIATGQSVTIGTDSFWTIANGEVQ